MNRLFIKIARLAGYMLVVLTGCFFANQYLIASDPFLVDVETHTLIVGDSHATYSLDTTYIRHSLNIAQEGESMLVTFLKLKAILPHNPRIQNVVLSFSPHNVSAFNDIKFMDPQWARSMFDRYYPLMSLSDLSGLNIDKRLYWQRFLQNRILLNGTYTINRLKELVGRGTPSYPYTTTNALLKGNYLYDERLENAIGRHYYDEGDPLPISSTEQHYMEALISFVVQQGVQLYLIDTPLHTEYRSRIPEMFKEAHEAAARQYASKPGIHFYAFDRLSMQDSLFYDFDHVNVDGARVVSRELDGVIHAAQ